MERTPDWPHFLGLNWTQDVLYEMYIWPHLYFTQISYCYSRSMTSEKNNAETSSVKSQVVTLLM